MTRHGRAGRLAAGVVLVAAVGAGCASGPPGLGRGACPYLRPRLLRVETDRLHLTDSPAASVTDLRAVAQDVALYVTTNLPDGGKARSDRPLVAFSAALTAFATSGGATTAALAAAEAPVAKECAVHGY